MIFVFNGPPSSGKDEGVRYLKNTFGFKARSFKYELFKKTFEHFSVSEEWFMNGYEDRTKKETPDQLLKGRSRREALIHVAEDIIKPNYGSDFFGTQAASSIQNEDNYCFSDSGFISEIQPLINKFGTEEIILIQLLRHGCDYSKDSRNYLHGNLEETYVCESKTDYDFTSSEILPIRMYRIHNNGSIEMFRQTLDIIYEKEEHAVRNQKTEDIQ